MTIGPGNTGGRVADAPHGHRGPMSIESGKPGARISNRPVAETAAFPSDPENPA